MVWKKFSIETLAQAEQDVCDMLYALGIDAVWIDDNQQVPEMLEKEGGFFEELQPTLPEDDGTARVIFFLDEAEDHSALIRQIEEALHKLAEFNEIGSGKISISVSDEQDWRDNWKAFFHTFSIGNVVIKPSWENLDEEDAAKTVIEIDPGISFGTGQHETTRMCIEALQKYITQGDRVLDIGFGSGILSVAALKLGADSVSGTDIDPDCLETVASNFERNGLAQEKGRFFIGNLTEDTMLAEKIGGGYDIVLANILADIIIGMKHKIAHAVRFGGIVVASGIIDFKEESVKEALEESGLCILEINHSGEWVSIVAKKQGHPA